MPRGGHLHPANKVAVPLHQQRVAIRTISILPTPDSARQVAGIDVTKSRRAPNFAGPNQLPGRRVGILLHMIVLMKSRHMPGNVWRYGGDEIGGTLQYVF